MDDPQHVRRLSLPTWRPFYWNDLGNDWPYRVAVTVALACFAFAVGMFLVGVALAVIAAAP